MKKIYKIEGLDCPNCANKIEKKLNESKIVQNISIDYVGKKIVIENEEITNDILNDLNKKIETIEDGVVILNNENYLNKVNIKNKKECNCNDCHNHNHNQKHSHEHSHKHSHKTNLITLCLGIVLLISGYFISNEIIKLIVMLISYLCIGYDILIKCFKNIRNLDFFDENFLMTIATIGAFGIKEYEEAIFVMLFYKIGEFLQDKAVDKSRNSITNLLKLKKNVVSIETSSGEYKEVDLNDVKIGDLFIVKPGEEIPIDGIIIDGSSNLDMSSLTGESDLVKKGINNEVLSGSLNKTSILKIKATKKFKDSTISKILDMVENASSNKSQTEQFITKFSRIYTPIVCFCALLILIIPTIILKQDFSDWLYKALSFLVVSCPCALVISIPLSYFGGIGLASKQGILIKGSNYLDLINNIDTFVFDKTGTLTYGNFKIDNIEILQEDKNLIYSICHTLEQNSTHPIAKSILNVTKTYPILKLENYEELVGMGVKGEINGDKYFIGNEKLLKLLSIDFCNAENVNYLIKNNKIIAKIIISDGIKESAYPMISYLKSKNKNIMMLTGDNDKAAKYVANKLDINYKSELLPSDKLNYVKNLNNEKTLFIGDGFNDAPVLVQSNIGIAMGDIGSDAAIQAADVVFMKEDLNKLVEFMKIGKYTKKIVIENISFALIIKLLVLLLITLGISTMWMAIFADVGVSFICILNTMRLLNHKFN